jgi:putative photosynthetic complex assembly protein
MTEIGDRPFPRGALVGAGVLIGFAMAATAAVRLGVVAPAASPHAVRMAAGVAATEVRELAFLDQSDGGVLIRDTRSGDVVARIEPARDQGFVRGVMRSFARERRMHGIGGTPPFQLTLWADGQLSLTDSATGRTVELGAFGPDNRAAFARLLKGTA